jgi:hypothetical protein
VRNTTARAGKSVTDLVGEMDNFDFGLERLLDGLQAWLEQNR